jgi:hypothetical protein
METRDISAYDAAMSDEFCSIKSAARLINAILLN